MEASSRHEHLSLTSSRLHGDYCSSWGGMGAQQRRTHQRWAKAKAARRLHAWVHAAAHLRQLCSSVTQLNSSTLQDAHSMHITGREHHSNRCQADAAAGDSVSTHHPLGACWHCLQQLHVACRCQHTQTATQTAAGTQHSFSSGPYYPLHVQHMHDHITAVMKTPQYS